jgi:hypothetical protein
MDVTLTSANSRDDMTPQPIRAEVWPDDRHHNSSIGKLLKQTAHVKADSPLIE